MSSSTETTTIRAARIIYPIGFNSHQVLPVIDFQEVQKVRSLDGKRFATVMFQEQLKIPHDDDHANVKVASRASLPHSDLELNATSMPLVSLVIVIMIVPGSFLTYSFYGPSACPESTVASARQTTYRMHSPTPRAAMWDYSTTIQKVQIYNIQIPTSKHEYLLLVEYASETGKADDCDTLSLFWVGVQKSSLSTDIMKRLQLGRPTLRALIGTEVPLKLVPFEPDVLGQPSTVLKSVWCVFPKRRFETTLKRLIITSSLTADQALAPIT
ncbi:hypothetical protein EDB19DRAFT_2022185 [Suillus lakei]|nr:hypothetical protein EDB19DRAFT_2022185 [Suillus lakei]